MDVEENVVSTAKQAAWSAGASQLAAAAPSCTQNACKLKSAPIAPSYAAVARLPL